MSYTSQSPTLGETQRCRGGNSVNVPAPTVGSQVEVPGQGKQKPEQCWLAVWFWVFSLSASPVQEKEGKTSEEALV